MKSVSIKLTVPYWVNYVATDSNGATWGFETRPKRRLVGLLGLWVNSTDCHHCRIGFGPKPKDWRKTLKRLK